MSRYIHKEHNVSVLLYHFVCPTKYRRLVLGDGVDEEVKAVCLEISQRYPIEFVEIGMDKDHAHFLIQSIPTYSPTQIITTVKSITAREIFKRKPVVKKKLWGGEFWTDGHFVNTVGQHGNEDTIRNMSKTKVRKKNTSKNIGLNSYRCLEVRFDTALLAAR